MRFSLKEKAAEAVLCSGFVPSNACYSPRVLYEKPSNPSCSADTVQSFRGTP